jgi:hypothetical protein
VHDGCQVVGAFVLDVPVLVPGDAFYVVEVTGAIFPDECKGVAEGVFVDVVPCGRGD